MQERSKKYAEERDSGIAVKVPSFRRFFGAVSTLTFRGSSVTTAHYAASGSFCAGAVPLRCRSWVVKSRAG
jgi:hypothetical protein